MSRGGGARGCHGLTKVGYPCDAWASSWVNGMGYCYWHSPNDPPPRSIPVEQPGADVPVRRRAERAIVRGLKYIGGFQYQVQAGREDGSFTIIADDAHTGNHEVTIYAREGARRVVDLDDVLDRLREHGAFRHGEHVVNYLEKERREGRL